MSNAQKLKKSKKKGMSPEAKATLGNAFKGIISNQCCVDGGKEGPWWVAVIFLILSIMLPLIPIMVNQSKVTGSQVVSGFNYGIDRGLTNTIKEAKDAGYVLKVSGGLLTYEGTSFTDTAPIAIDTIEREVTKETYNFFLYFTEKTGIEYDVLFKEVSNQKFVVGTKDPYVPVEGEDIKYYTPSFVIFTPNTMAFAMYKTDSSLSVASIEYGLTWNHTYSENLLATLLGDPIADDPSGAKQQQQTLNNFKVLLDQTYLDAKNTNFRNNTLIYLGVYAGLIFFLGLMVFVLTRGKKNMFHFLSFFACQKITWWASFTPAVLGMIFAFIFSQNMIGQMSFVIFLALRIMWMSMRQLRPVQ